MATDAMTRQPMTRSPMTPHRTRRRLVAALVVATAAVAATVVTGATASAGHNSGVRYVHFGDGAQACLPGQALPCTAGAGAGVSNTLYVTQSLVDGGYRYTDVIGTALDPSMAWLAVTLGARCRADYRIDRAHVELGHSTWEGWNDPDEAGQWSHGFEARQIAVGAKTMSDRHLPVDVDVDTLLEDLVWGQHSVQQMVDWGEEMVDTWTDLGVDREEARRRSYLETYEIPMHAEVQCRRNSLFGLFEVREMHDSATVPVRVVWLGVGAEPGEEWTGGWRDAQLPEPDPVPEPPTPPEPAGVPLTSDTWVTQAHLSVIPDPDDMCRLHLSGTIVSNGETEVTYRFVDQLGSHSQTYATTLDGTFTGFVDHHVDLEPVPTGDGFDPGLATADDGAVGGLTAAPTDRVQGAYRLQVLTPNPLQSAVADYNVPPCVAGAGEAPESTPTTTTTVPPGPVVGLSAATTTTTSTTLPPSSGRPGGLTAR